MTTSFQLAAAAFLMAASTTHAATLPVAGEAMCEGPLELGGEDCVLTWNFPDFTADTVRIERFNTDKDEWEAVPGLESVGAAARLNKAIANNALYRAVAGSVEQGCISSTAEWAIVQMSSKEEVLQWNEDHPEAVVMMSRQDEFEFSLRNMNASLLYMFIDKVASMDMLVPMTKPSVKPDPKNKSGTFYCDSYRQAMYMIYEGNRDPAAYKTWLRDWSPFLYSRQFASQTD
jgi:hypothetical protein